MTRGLIVLVLGTVPTLLSAQLGEFQIGVVGSYGRRDPYREGAGLALGVAPGRLVYVGLRWIYYRGATTAQFAPPPAGPAQVWNHAQVFATDLDLQIPALGGLLETRPTVGLGVVRFAQRGRPAGGEISAQSKEFFAAPGLALQLNAGRIAVIPQLQYYFTGRTELSWPVHNKSLALSLRLVWWSEVRRIRR